MFFFKNTKKTDSIAEGELRRLSQVFENTAAPDQPHLLENDGRKAIWAVKLAEGRNAFVSASRTPAMNDENYVVQVDARRFYYHWLKSTLEGGGDCVPVQNMPQDRKYRYAQEGFDEGRDNPVPLAEVHAGGEGRIGFTNGVTRSFWLIANEAESFPVQTNGPESARKLHELAGIGAGPKTFEQLFTDPNA